MGNRTFAHGIIEGEGPYCRSDGSMFVVEMASKRACITKIGPDGKIVGGIKTGGRPNGLTMDGDGRLWIAEARSGAVICYDQSGQQVVRIEEGLGGRFLWANDLRFGPDDHLYLTDSGIIDTTIFKGTEIDPNYQTLPYEGCVYEIDPRKGKVIRKIDSGFRFTNGIAFGPDNHLYVNETLTGMIYRYDLFGACPARRENFCNVNRPDFPEGWRGPDGMAFGQDGRLYCTVYNQADVTVVDGDGKISGRLPTNGTKPTNIAFASSGKISYVTEVELSTVEELEMPCEGLPLYAPHLNI